MPWVGLGLGTGTGLAHELAWAPLSAAATWVILATPLVGTQAETQGTQGELRELSPRISGNSGGNSGAAPRSGGCVFNGAWRGFVVVIVQNRTAKTAFCV